MKKKILVVGGAGYIGSHMVKCLLDAGEPVVVIDNLSSGFREAVLGGEFIQGDISDKALLDRVLSTGAIDTVMHFASFIQVGESAVHPGKYYQNNLGNTITLLNAIAEHCVPFFVFSSTAAIFGEPQCVPIDEEHPQTPMNPYGRSKWMVEQVLPDYERAYGMRSVALRYFNAAGATPDGLLGERHDPETHLIPVGLRVASQRLKVLTVFGETYDTPDGTCIRDYIHVCDLCDAHLLAVRYLRAGGVSRNFNLGNGLGYSVRQVIDCIERITKLKVPILVSEKRQGDPARLVADSRRASDILGWRPQYPNLEEIIKHAWNWEKKNYVKETSF